MSKLTDELTKLAALKERGLLTPEEFDAQKARLLAASQGAAPATPSGAAYSAPTPSGAGSPPSFISSTRGKIIAAAGVGAVGLLVVAAMSGGSSPQSYAPVQPAGSPLGGQATTPPVASASAGPAGVAPQPGAGAENTAPPPAQDASGSSALPAGKYACYTFSGGRLNYTFMDVLITGANTYSSGGETFRFHQGAGNQIVFDDGPLAGHPATVTKGPSINLGATTCDLEK